MAGVVATLSIVVVFAACSTARPARDGGGDDSGVGSDAGDASAGDAGAPGSTCESCTNNSDCVSDHQCVAFGGAWACLPRCTPTLPDCREGFLCGGMETTFCAPIDGLCCVDEDNDTYGQGFQCVGRDCDDDDPDVHPGVPDRCNDIDEDCDPATANGSNDSAVGVACDGADLDLCEEGISFCGASGEIECDDATADNPDLCNGIDDDCDPTTLDGKDEALVGTACDSSADADSCLDDLYFCNSALPAIQCQDLAGSANDICDGADNDCDPATADGAGDPLVGVACDGTGPGGDVDLCAEGFTYCAGGEVLCNDPNDVDLELCNGLNDDCDPSTVDGAQDSDVGVLCDGSDGDACKEGHVVCMAGGYEQCDDNSATNVEICNGIDDDCQNGVDEMNPDVSCPSQYPGASNVADWSCSGACVIVSCNSTADDIDNWVANGCECTPMDSYPSTCSAASNTTVGLGASVTRTGKIATATGSDWLRFSFTERAAPGTYHPKVAMTNTGGGQFKMDVRTSCAALASCDLGTGAAITTWEGVWSYGTAPVDNDPRVTSVWVRVFRAASDAPTCASYTLEATNP